jgi:probable rRNA maturation factor
MAAPARPATRLHIVVLAPDGARRPAGLASWLAAVAPRAAQGELAVALVSDRRMRTLNRTFRGVDRVTDVLSFPASAPAARPAMLGDIVIATGVATRQAAAAGHALGTELRVLALHGLLHLLGHDHDTDGGAMARLERRLRRRGQLREGLIERGEARHSPRARR